MNEMQMKMVNLNDLVPENYAYRKIKSAIDFKRLMHNVHVREGETGANGYGKERLLTCLILQFMEDLSDRELERFLRENIAGKWFVGFGLCEKTQDYSTFCKFRNDVGCKQISTMFDAMKSLLKSKGYFRCIHLCGCNSACEQAKHVGRT